MIKKEIPSREPVGYVVKQNHNFFLMEWLKMGSCSATVNKSLKEIESYMSVFWVLKVQIYYKSFNLSFFDVCSVFLLGQTHSETAL